MMKKQIGRGFVLIDQLNQKIPSTHVCSGCGKILLEAYDCPNRFIEECQRVFCGECFKNQEKCGECEKKELRRNEQIEDGIKDRYRIKCLKCEDELLIGAFEFHQKFECFMRDCQKGCGIKISKGNEQMHFDQVCRKQELKCSACGKAGEREEILEHQIECKKIEGYSKLNYALYSKCFAIYIAVGKYKRLKDLKSPPHDLREMKNCLENHGFISDESSILSDEKATKSSIDNLFETFAKQKDAKMVERSFLLVYLSGHGMEQNENFYFCPHDFDQEKASTTGLNLHHLVKTVKGYNCKHVLFVLDCCYGGGILL